LIVIYGGELGMRVELTPREITIGRDDDNDIYVPLHTISRRHARIFVREQEHYVEDLDSTNGTFLNEQELDRPEPLLNGDLLRCGGAVFKFIAGGNVEALYHEEIYRLTITDGLTQVANKRHLEDFLEREIARAARHERPLTLVLFDIDHFKAVNDRYGHLAGDHVLKGIAAIVATQVRRDEILARFGGEEFAVVLPETALDHAAAFCERIRAEVEAATFQYDGEPLRATISVGAAPLAAGDTMESLIARADAHLYKAKEEGRNRVVAGA
jgi:diguanylate cyclase (GGDEF)-like protein